MTVTNKIKKIENQEKESQLKLYFVITMSSVSISINFLESQGV